MSAQKPPHAVNALLSAALSRAVAARDIKNCDPLSDLASFDDSRQSTGATLDLDSSHFDRIETSETACEVVRPQLLDMSDAGGLTAVIDQLESGCPAVKEAVFREWSRAGSETKAKAFKSIVSRLPSATPGSLEVLIEAFAHVATSDDDVAIQLLRTYSSNGSCWVRLQATKGLSYVASKGNEAALSVVATRVNDSSWQVREAAARALGLLIAESTDAQVVAGLRTLLRDRSPLVRDAANTALQGLPFTVTTIATSPNSSPGALGMHSGTSRAILEPVVSGGEIVASGQQQLGAVRRDDAFVEPCSRSRVTDAPYLTNSVCASVAVAVGLVALVAAVTARRRHV